MAPVLAGAGGGLTLGRPWCGRWPQPKESGTGCQKRRKGGRLECPPHTGTCQLVVGTRQAGIADTGGTAREEALLAVRSAESEAFISPACEGWVSRTPSPIQSAESAALIIPGCKARETPSIFAQENNEVDGY